MPENNSVRFKKGPSNFIETSLSDLEDIYKKKPEWIHLDSGGVLSVLSLARITHTPSSMMKVIINFVDRSSFSIVTTSYQKMVKIGTC